MVPALLPLHLVLIVAAAFLVGVRAFRETQPGGTAEDEDSAQLHRFAKFAGIGLVLLMIAVIFGLDLGFVHMERVIQ